MQSDQNFGERYPSLLWHTYGMLDLAVVTEFEVSIVNGKID